MENASFLGGLAYVLGEKTFDVEASAAAGRTVSTAQDLRAAGFAQHHVCGSTLGAYEMARDAARTAISTIEGSVDAIVYANCLPLNANLGDPAEYNASRDVKYLMEFAGSRLQADLELTEAGVWGLNQQACTGMLGAVRLAAALLATEPNWEHVVCVTADCFPADAIYEQGYQLISDGAAACTVSRHAGSGRAFRVIGGHQITNGALAQASDDETVGAFFGSAVRAINETLDKFAMSADDVAWIVAQNTNVHAWDILSRLVNVDRERVWLPSIADAGHMISGDNIVNLKLLGDRDMVQPGDRILMFMAGFGLNWQSLVVEAVEEESA